MAGLPDFVAELRRRHVIRVAAIYAVVAWLIIQVAATVQPFLRLPAWTVTLVIVLVALGVPVALVLGWAFDLTPDGIRRSTIAEQRDAATVPGNRRRFSVATGLVLLISLAAGGWLWYSRRLPDALSKSIAVLPFTNLSADRANEYFADGIHEQVLTQLTQIADLHVISRTSVMQYKQAQRNLREIAQALGVGTVLEGSVQRDQNRVRINAQLIDARRDKHLWSQNYDRDLTDVFAIQSSIAQEIASALRAELTQNERAVLSAPPTGNVQAYDLYLRGKQQRIGSARADVEVKIDLYRRALALDSTFALAQIELAHSLLTLVDRFFLAGMVAEAEAAASRALRLAPASAEAHALLSRIKARTGDDDGALAEAAIAREIQPGNPDHLDRVATLLSWRGLYGEAVRLLQQAIELDPGNANAHVALARALAGQQRWEEAEAQLDRAIALAPKDLDPFVTKFSYRAARVERLEELRPLLEAGITRYGQPALGGRMIRGSGELVALLLELRPDFFDALSLTAGVDSVDYYLVTGLVRLHQNRPAEARAAFETDRQVGEARVSARFGEADPRFRNLDYSAWAHSDLALALAALGRAEEAVAAAQRGAEMAPLTMPRTVAIYNAWILARVYMSVGRHDDAIAVLQRILAAPHATIAGFTPARLRIDPMFAPLRGKPAFERLTNRSQTP